MFRIEIVKEFGHASCGMENEVSLGFQDYESQKKIISEIKSSWKGYKKENKQVDLGDLELEKLLDDEGDAQGFKYFVRLSRSEFSLSEAEDPITGTFTVDLYSNNRRNLDRLVNAVCKIK